MRKIPKLATTTLLAMALCLLLQGLTPIAYAVSSESTSESSNKAVEVDFSEETQKLKLEKGKNYIISCPITGDGWLVTDVSFCIRKNVWISISDKTSSKYLSVQQISETEPGKVQLLVNCKDFNLVGFRVFLENELTGETKNYSFALTVSSPQAAINNVLVVVPDNDDDDDDSSGVPPEPSPIPPTGQPEEVPPEEEPPVNPPDEEDPPSVPTPKPIVIDTTGWSFESITAVYDGTEHTVQVTGLPDYVTPVYTNNTRTNAGSSTAHVSFIVPEGYATPADMEATITIDKAPLYVITDKNMVVNKDGKLHFSIPDGALPDGVNYSYTVNKVLADSDYTIDNTGMYLIETDFEFTDDFSEEMRQNYLTDPSTAIYNVLEHEDIEPSQYGLNFKLYLKQEESENPDEIRVTVSIKFDSSSGRNSVLTYKPVFDSSVLTYVGSELPEGMGAGVINKYGVVSAYTDSFGLLNDGPLTTFIFKVNEGADAKNLPFTITEASGVWIAPDPSVIDKSTSYTSAIVLNPDVAVDNQFTVMLPYPGGQQTTNLEALSEEEATGEEATPPAEEKVPEVEATPPAEVEDAEVEAVPPAEVEDAEVEATPPTVEEDAEVEATPPAVEEDAEVEATPPAVEEDAEVEAIPPAMVA